MCYLLFLTLVFDTLKLFFDSVNTLLHTPILRLNNNLDNFFHLKEVKLKNLEFN